MLIVIYFYYATIPIISLQVWENIPTFATTTTNEFFYNYNYTNLQD